MIDEVVGQPEADKAYRAADFVQDTGNFRTRAADQGNEYAQFFLNRADSLHPPSVMLAATRLLHHMSRIFRDNSLPNSGPVGMRIDRKRLQRLREKKIATGHKPDGHEEYTGPTLSM